MSSFKINISGEDFVRKNIKKITGEVKEKVQDSLNDFGLNTVNDAKRNTPVDEGLLRNSITFVKHDLSVEVIAASDYAAFVEFGTRRYAAKHVASLPPEWQSFAAKFKGQGGGNMDEFVQRIMAWVQRKGIGAQRTKSGNVSGSRSSLADMQQAAYAIALHILQNGTKAHPFLYPAVEKNKDILIKELKALLN